MPKSLAGPALRQPPTSITSGIAGWLAACRAGGLAVSPRAGLRWAGQDGVGSGCVGQAGARGPGLGGDRETVGREERGVGGGARRRSGGKGGDEGERKRLVRITGMICFRYTHAAPCREAARHSAARGHQKGSISPTGHPKTVQARSQLTCHSADCCDRGPSMLGLEGGLFFFLGIFWHRFCHPNIEEPRSQQSAEWQVNCDRGCSLFFSKFYKLSSGLFIFFRNSIN